jgi:hypothetical protein
MAFNHSIVNALYEPAINRTLIGYYNEKAVSDEFRKGHFFRRMAIAVGSVVAPWWIGNSDKIADRFKQLLDDSEDAQTLKRRLEDVRRRAQKSGRVLGSARDVYAQRAKLDGEFVFVDSGLCHCSAIPAASVLGKQVRDGGPDQKWILSDYPPEGMDQTRNPSFVEQVGYLGIPAETERQLSTQLPFVRDLAWYPHCRFVGILDGSGVVKDHFPTVRFVAGWIRRPQLYGQAFNELLDVATRNSDSTYALPELLTEASARLALYYFVPTFYFSNGLDYADISPDLRTIIRSLVSRFPGEMGSSLAALYRDRVKL